MELIALRRERYSINKLLPWDIDTYDARIREYDFQLLQDLAQDHTSGWKLLHDCDRTGIAVYMSNFKFRVGKRYHPEFSASNGSLSDTASTGSYTDSTSSNGDTGSRAQALQCFKFVGTIKHNYHVVCSALTDTGLRHRTDPQITGTTPLEFLPAETDPDDPDNAAYASAVVLQKLQISKLIKPHEFVVHVSVNHYPESNRYAVVIKSAMHKKADAMRGSKKAPRMTVFGGHILQKVDDNTTRYTIPTMFDFGKRPLREFPFVGERLFKLLGTSRARKLHRNLVQVCDEIAPMMENADQVVSITLNSANYLQQTITENEKALRFRLSDTGSLTADSDLDEFDQLDIEDDEEEDDTLEA